MRPTIIPACKNIGTTHLSGGCYRLHPVEWNVGEVAGYPASFALSEHIMIAEVWEDPARFAAFAALLEANGIQRYWKEG